MRRREFIAVMGAAGLAWPDLAKAQRPATPMRRIGVLMTLAADDPEAKARVAALLQSLQELGWINGRNVQVDFRWPGGDAERTRQLAAELVALSPDVILANASQAAGAVLKATRTVPVVFTTVADPVGAGFVASLARPSGNATGFTSFEYGIGGKWLQLLKEIAPRVTRVGVLRDAAIAAGPGQLEVIQAEAASAGVEVNPLGMADAAEIERGIADFARTPNGGLIVTASPLAGFHRKLIIALAAEKRLPAVYNARFFATGGGLLAYGPDRVDPFKRAAIYADRILRGDKPADLPVQAPTKYEMVLNLKTAKALGLDIPQKMLLRADEVIE